MKRQDVAKLPIGTIVKIGRGKQNPLDAEITGPVQQIKTSSYGQAKGIWTVEVELLVEPDDRRGARWALPADRFLFSEGRGYWVSHGRVTPVDKPFRIECRYVRDVEAEAERARERAAAAKAERAEAQRIQAAIEDRRQWSLSHVRLSGLKGTPAYLTETCNGKGHVVVSEPRDLDEARAIIEALPGHRIRIEFELDNDGKLVER